MAKYGQSTFAVNCKKHGNADSKRDRNLREVGIEKPSRRKSCCPLCRKEYIHRHNIKNPESIDWRYVSFEESEK